MRIYLDACVLSRLSDEKTQPRIRKESGAALDLLRLVSLGKLRWFASSVLKREVELNPNEMKRKDGLRLLSYAEYEALPIILVKARAAHLANCGYGTLDALHLACAEALQVDVLLTTDDRFLKRAVRNVGNPLVRVANPVDWLQEKFAWLPMKS